jgi:hypothetical protein
MVAHVNDLNFARLERLRWMFGGAEKVYRLLINFLPPEGSPTTTPSSTRKKEDTKRPCIA